MTRILVAEDDPNIREGLITTLESEGYAVTAAADGREALAAYGRESIDLAVLDVMMPEISGYDVCRTLRTGDPKLPIMMLTAKGEEIDKVVGLRLGADDYMTKPFGIHELLARVEALLRRSQLTQSENRASDKPFTFGPWSVDPTRLQADQNDRTISLSARELKLLHVFANHPDQVLDRNRLLQEGWGRDYLGTSRTLDQHIAQLRKKVEEDNGNPKLITTVHGVGYRHNP
ncbi:MAG: response regulator transcription factor [Acidobacteriota bacterium]|nr:response regulator transcription factor [Acidobacteriota bacterium]